MRNYTYIILFYFRFFNMFLTIANFLDFIVFWHFLQAFYFLHKKYLVKLYIMLKFFEIGKNALQNVDSKGNFVYNYVEIIYALHKFLVSP